MYTPHTTFVFFTYSMLHDNSRPKRHPERPRIQCPKCGEEFSHKYYKTKHQPKCDTEQISSTDTSDVLDNVPEVSSNHDEMDSDPEIGEREAIREYVLQSAGLQQNMSVEDMRAFFSDYGRQSSASGVSSEPIGSESELASSGEDFMDSKDDDVIRLCSIFVGQWQGRNNITDTATVELLKFLKTLFSKLQEEDIAQRFPDTLEKFDRFLGINGQNFTRFVVCPECFSLYSYDDCWCLIEGERFSKKCPYVPYPNHTQRFRRGRCGATLLKTEKSETGKTVLTPASVYLYKSPKETLQTMVMRPLYEEMCNHWRNGRTVEADLMSDIYDGRIWKEFEDCGFFREPTSYGMVLNVDWFAPFKHSTYSIGAIYMVNANLPRSERFKIEHVIVVGIIPNMAHEPPTNTFIKPIVEELIDAWEHGWQMKSYTSPDHARIFRVALVCTGADIPAARKLCGFLGHSATAGCSRCTKRFPGKLGEKNYGGFNRSCPDAGWIPRTNEGHRQQCAEICQLPTKTLKEAKEAEYGSRYSVLLELPYYRPINMCTIDPMHNLYLGTAKHMVHVWRSTGLLTDAHCEQIQKSVDEIKVPSDMGKIPRKIGAKFSKMTADEWKNWTLYFSLLVLKDILPKKDLECWRKFVLACRLFHSKIIKMCDAEKADRLMVSFCKKFEQLYGSERVTPNMHLGCHLLEVIVDYGPVYSFWLFAFERYNGILGAKHTNRRNIEPQILRKLLREQAVYAFVLPECEGDTCTLHCYVEKQHCRMRERGSLHDIGHGQITGDLLKVIAMSHREHPIMTDWSTGVQMYQINSQKVFTFSEENFHNLQSMYRILYAHVGAEIEVSPSAREVTHVQFCGEILGTASSRSCRSSLIRAFWPDENGSICVRHEVFDTAWPGQIKFFILHHVVIGDQARLHLLANVQWYAKCQTEVKEAYGSAVDVWQNHLFIQNGAASFIPVQRIKCKFIQAPVTFRRRQYVGVVSRNRLGC